MSGRPLLAHTHGMDRKTLMADWPRGADDAASASRLVAHGYPALAPVIPDMVRWLKTNGVVRDVFAASLADAGGSAAEPVRAALAGNHEQQVEHLIRVVLPGWSREDLRLLEPDLEGWLQRGSLLGLNILALALLQRAGVETHAPIAEWAGLFRQRLRAQSDELDRIEAELGGGRRTPPKS